MAASPEAQVPKTDNDPVTAPITIGPSPAQEPLLHAGTSLEQAVEDRVIKGMNEDGTIRIPDHVPRGLVENPDAGGAREVVPGDDKKSWVKPIALGAIGLVAALGIGGYAFGVGKTKGESDALKSEAGSDRSTSASYKPTPEQKVEQETAITPETREFIDKFDLQRKAVLSEILKRFAEDNFTIDDYHMYEGRSIEEAYREMSPTAILDRNSAKNTYLTLFLDEKDALSQVGIAARPGTPAYKNFVDGIRQVDNGKRQPSTDEDILIQSKYFENGTFIDQKGNPVISATNTPTQVISAMSQRERTNTVYTFQWDTTEGDSRGDWRLVTAAASSDAIGYIDPLTVKDLRIAGN